MVDCKIRKDLLSDDKNFVRAAVDNRLNKYSQSKDYEIMMEDQRRQFKIREGLD